MGQRAITIYTPESTAAHITAEDDAFIYRMIFGADSGILGGLTCVRVDNNTVRLSGGGVMNRGHILRIPDGETLELTVSSGTAGYRRYDSVIAEFIKGGGSDADSYQIRVIKGTASAGMPAAPTLTATNLLNKGNINQIELFRLTIDGTALSDITQIAGRLNGGGASDTSAESGNSSGSTASVGAAAGSISSSGVLVSKVSSTVSSPTVHYSASYTASQSGSALSVKPSFTAWLNSSQSTLGTGVKLTVYARLNGGAWQSAVIKNPSESWSGTGRHSVGLTLSANSAASTAKIEFYVTRSGSTYSGTAGNLGSASNPRSCTIKLI